MNHKNSSNNHGFTLIEIMIALTVFATFIVAYITGEGYNVTDSITMKRELVLQKLCEYKINEIKLNPPEFKKSLTQSADTGNFDDIDYPDYEYKVEYNNFKIPDLTKLKSMAGGNTQEDDDKDSGASAVEKAIFENMSKNIEEIIWQVRVTVTQKGSDFPFTLTAWLTNTQAKVNINI